MSARLAAFLVWGLVAACGVYWALRLGATPRPVPEHAQPVGGTALARGDIARLFASPAVAVAPGVVVAEPGLASRFKLVGVMAPRGAQRERPQGVALIAVDGKPARPYRVGARLDGELVLQTVALRSATLGPQGGAPALQLDLAPLPPPATGSLPAGGRAGVAGGFTLPPGTPALRVPAPGTPPAGSTVAIEPVPPQQQDDDLSERAVGAEPSGAANPDNRR